MCQGEATSRELMDAWQHESLHLTPCNLGLSESHGTWLKICGQHDKKVHLLKDLTWPMILLHLVNDTVATTACYGIILIL